MTESKEAFVPVFTVVVPIYNAEKYLKKALRSILEQEFSDFDRSSFTISTVFEVAGEGLFHYIRSDGAQTAFHGFRNVAAGSVEHIIGDHHLHGCIDFRLGHTGFRFLDIQDNLFARCISNIFFE